MKFGEELLFCGGRFIEGEGFKNHNHIDFLIFELCPESIVGEALKIVASGCLFTNFFGNDYAQTGMGGSGGAREDEVGSRGFSGASAKL